jgi:hypothetical protein
VVVEDDYYTAVDRLKRRAENTGAGFVGEAGSGRCGLPSFPLRRSRAAHNLDRLRAAHPDLDCPDGPLPYARSKEQQGNIEQVLIEYAALAGYYPGEEARCPLALLLQKTGRVPEARTLFQQVVRSVERAITAPSGTGMRSRAAISLVKPHAIIGLSPAEEVGFGVDSVEKGIALAVAGCGSRLLVRVLRKATGPACAQVAGIGVGGVISFASLRRFCVVAARRNSSRGPAWSAQAQAIEAQDALQVGE